LGFKIDRTPNDPTDALEPSWCSASTVNSGAKNLVFTAGHCLLGTGDPTDNDWSHSVSFRDFVYYPDASGPSAPYGEWAAQAAFVPQEWAQSGDGRYDVGAVLLWPSEFTRGERVVDVVGANGIRFNEPAQQDAYAFGYPQNYDGGESLYYCHARSHWGYLKPIIWMVCDMSHGASGGPWLMNFNGELGDLFSVSSRGPVGQIWGPLFDQKIRDFYEAIVGSDFQSRGRMAYTHQDFGVDGEDYGIYATSNDIFSESDAHKLLPTYGLGTDINPSYSPPVGAVAYQSNQGDTFASTSDYEIYTTAVKGNDNPHPITHNTVDDRDPSFWSIVRPMETRSKIAYEGYDGNDYEIYTINFLDGKPTGGISQITNNTVADRAPSYSPDGEKIAYTSNDGNDYEIYQISASGGTPVQVTFNQRSEFDPTYSPDGKWIAFSGSTGGGDYEIYKVLLSKTPGIFHEPIQITYNAKGARKPSYSPDGYHIVYHSYDGNDYELYTIDLRYGYVRQLTSNNTNDCCPTWG